ncbi:YkvA family protein [Sphingomonas donggukensis]|uniref:YkvA family protein n=1 Tax=Sphingomonas donggukensis TaxID=2949093 RepID=A0ABY4TUB8_9SPHN|nr:YkvA family protein [Sphingomonas donggukensis]URW75995.1 YkvA family protein [Sphingomonas donggukensis]
MGPSLAHRLRIETHAVWLAVRDPRTPWPARALGMIVAAYALSPIDLIPDVIPVLGLLDDALLIPAGVWLMTRLIPAALMAEFRATAEQAAERPVSRTGVVLVVATWIAVLVALWWLLRGRWD